jgi:hypothetical protein
MKTNILGLPVQESELITELNTLLSNISGLLQNQRFIGIEENVFLICMLSLKKRNDSQLK